MNEDCEPSGSVKLETPSENTMLIASSSCTPLGTGLWKAQTVDCPKRYPVLAHSIDVLQQLERFVALSHLLGMLLRARAATPVEKGALPQAPSLV